MAFLAGRWKPQRLVIDAGAGRAQEITHVAGGAIGAEASELAHGSTCVASHAVQCGMGTQQGKAVLVRFDTLD